MSEEKNIIEYFLVDSPLTEKGDRALSNFICGYMVIQAIHNFMALTDHNGSLWQVLSKGIMAVLLLICIFHIVRRVFFASVVAELLLTGCLLFSFFYADVSEGFSSLSFNLLFAYLPMGLACYAINDYSILLKRLYKSAILIEIVTLVTFLVAQLATYSMTSGFLLLLPILLHIDRYIKRKKWYDALLPIIDIAFIIMYASRGPILCIGIYITMFILFESSVDKRKKTLFILLTLLLSFILYVNLFSINELFSKATGNQDQGSRTIRLVQTNAIGYDANRFSIFIHYGNKILQTPIWGKGLAASWDYSSYPHNVVLELCLAFGIPIGGMLSISLLHVWLFGIRQHNDTLRRLSQLFVAGTVSLMWSGTFLKDPTFFVCLALCLKGYKKRYRNPLF